MKFVLELGVIQVHFIRNLTRRAISQRVEVLSVKRELMSHTLRLFPLPPPLLTLTLAHLLYLLQVPRHNRIFHSRSLPRRAQLILLSTLLVLLFFELRGPAIRKRIAKARVVSGTAETLQGRTSVVPDWGGS